jgi:hypothetical protein
MPITIGGGDFTRQDSRAIKIIDGLSRDHPIHPDKCTENPPPMSTHEEHKQNQTHPQQERPAPRYTPRFAS